MEGILAIVFIFGGGTMFLLAISPIGRAIASRIQANAADRLTDETVERIEATQQALLDEMEGFRHEMVEMQERLDFAERLLARHQQELPPPVTDQS